MADKKNVSSNMAEFYLCSTLIIAQLYLIKKKKLYNAILHYLTSRKKSQVSDLVIVSDFLIRDLNKKNVFNQIKSFYSIINKHINV